MDPFFHTGLSISDSLKTVRKSVLIYETIIQSDKLKIPAEYKSKIISVEKYCTKPELEMLFIIAEQLTGAYEKVKSGMKPKDFAKANIKLGKKKYDNSTAFYTEYFG